MTQPLEGHADRRFDGELNTLHLRILEMGGLVLSQCRLALQALLKQDLVAAQTVLEREPKVDSLEASVDNIIVELFCKRAPVAKDLRITMAFSKIVVDLERIGDEAAKIANIVQMLNDGSQTKPGKHQMRDIASMGKLSLSYIDTALQALDTLDISLAQSLLNSEIELDDEFQLALRHLTTFVLEDVRNLGHSINLTLMLKALERLGAHASNIAEYVVYLVDGINIRHQRRATDKTNGKN